MNDDAGPICARCGQPVQVEWDREWLEGDVCHGCAYQVIDQLRAELAAATKLVKLEAAIRRDTVLAKETLERRVHVLEALLDSVDARLAVIMAGIRTERGA